MTVFKGRLRALDGRNRARLLFYFCGFLIIAQTAAAAEESHVEEIGLSTADLYRICSNAAPPCNAYLSGVIDTALLNHHLFTRSRDRGFIGPGQITFCFNDEKRDVDLPRLFIDFVDSAPERNDFSAAETVMLVMSAEFPCPELAED